MQTGSLPSGNSLALNVINANGTSVTAGSRSDLTKIWGRSSVLIRVTSFLHTLKNAGIRATYPGRRFFADFIVGTANTALKGTILGNKLGYKAGAELCHILGIRKSSRVGDVAFAGSIILGAVGSTLADCAAIPGGLLSAGKNLCSGKTLKTAVKGDIQQTRSVEWNRLIKNCVQNMNQYNEYIDDVNELIEDRSPPPECKYQIV